MDKKAYTDLEQSKKLVEILPIESADMRFCFSHTLGGRIIGHYPMIGREPSMGTIPCWSLAALLEILPCKLQIGLAINDYHEDNDIKERYAIGSVGSDNYDCYADNPVDACYKLILKLHEQKLI